MTSINDVWSGKPHDPKKQRLGEILDRVNDLYGAEVSDDDKLHFAHNIVDRIELNEALMAQVRTHNETKIMHGMFPRMVLGGLRKKEKLSVSLLRDEKKVGSLRC
ncbi:hypothetical protein ACFO0O_16325 [Cobetia amphilecti]|uniref:Uncharacterized protein n=1 Tax=Cobetia amphilecti TaxID=1055104 RepID=A0ABT6UVT9_9GAMM|nr:hypothetical protein [Cobetia amphilecti]MDI5885647.1 hypothetical protein [Cobetia amphilecti]